MSHALFRREVLAAREAQWLGTVLLAPRVSHALFAAFAALTTAGVVSLLLLADYTKKAHIAGWLVPREGLVQVFAPQPGIAAEIHVKEGDEVRKGDPLLVLSAELESKALGATRTRVVNGLAARRDSLQEERRGVERLAARRRKSVSDRLDALDSERAQLDREIALQESRLKVAEESLEQQRALREQSLVTDQGLQSAQENRIDQQSKLGALERLRVATSRERLALEEEQGELPLKCEAEMANLDRGIAAVEQELAEAEARREIVVPAPQTGTVTAVHAVRGGLSDPHVPLLGILPAGSKLEAHMFVPSRSMGFLRRGQRVLLRYHAYPFQKFGHQEGVVEEISRSAMNPAE
ncbi:HlyD family efflux transporter periplasmic adaptor subunit, partial [bacterium]|nr:HlyD family efflux transporter periplasmic adaptor subunit [bacterium]